MDERGRMMVAISFNQDMGDGWEFADVPEYPERFSSEAMRLGTTLFHRTSRRLTLTDSGAGLAERIALFLALSLNVVGWWILCGRVMGKLGLAYGAGLMLLLSNFVSRGFFAFVMSTGVLLLPPGITP